MRVNHTITEWLGLTAKDLLYTPLHSALSSGGRIAYETHIKPLLRMQGFVDELSFDLLNQKEERIPFIANVSERRDSEGKHVSTRFALFRATDRRSYEKSLLAARQAAETEVQRERETALLREQFIAVLGHDLRNPLTAILSGINILKRSKTLSERETQIVDGMSKSAWRAEKLISDLLDFAQGRLGEGLVLQRSANTDLMSILTQIVDEARAMAPDRTIELDVSTERPVYCDGERIGQLLANLISNAITHGDPSRDVTVTAETRNKDFALIVENFGDPIPDAALENLFQPFFRGEVRDSRGGLGLGLFIVSEIAKAHGGTVDVISNKTSTQFRLIIPLDAEGK